MGEVTRLNAQKGDNIQVRCNRYQYANKEYYTVDGKVIQATKTRLTVSYITEKGTKVQKVFSRDSGLIYPYIPNSYSSLS